MYPNFNRNTPFGLYHYASNGPNAWVVEIIVPIEVGCQSNPTFNGSGATPEAAYRCLLVYIAWKLAERAY
jgi:hypothetical protein